MKNVQSYTANKTVSPQHCVWYDDKEIIEQFLNSLPELNSLLKARGEAGYERNERMNEYCILGRFWLDTCGNCMKIVGYVPKDEFPNMPDVMAKEEFWSLLGSDTTISFSMGSNIPDEHIECPFCGKAWRSHNCHDTVRIASTEVYPLDEFIGKTLGELKAAYAAKTDAKYFMQSGILIRNDRFIDLSPEYPDTDKNWQKDLVINERGLVSEHEGITDEYVIQVGDEGYFNVWKYYHSQCHIDSVAADSDFLENNSYFKNLAGAAYADIVIRKELLDAGVALVQGDRTRSEVPYTLTGKLGNSTFTRAWTYWMVACMVPLKVAQEMYEDEVGAKFVRVAGHCGCPAPDEWVTYYAPDGKKLAPLSEKPEEGKILDWCTGEGGYRFVDDPALEAEAFVTSYHIDTMQGLKLFVDTLRKHNLV